MCDAVSAVTAVVGLVGAAGQKSEAKKSRRLIAGQAAERKKSISERPQEAKRRERRSLLGGQGPRSTILTGPGGLTTQATTAQRTLLGGSI